MKDTRFDGERLKEAMGLMTSADLASKLGCPKSNISMYLSGKREPSKMAIQYMSLVLGVNPAWLCGLDVPKYSNAKIVSVGEFSSLSEDESKLISSFRNLSIQDREAVMQIVSSMALSTDAGKNSAISNLGKAQ